jgi:hypothetical protein
MPVSHHAVRLLIDARFESMVAPENSYGLVLHANDTRGSPQLT